MKYFKYYEVPVPGKQAHLIAYYTLNNMASFEGDMYFPYKWNTVGENKYVPCLESVHDAKRVAETWIFPDELRREVTKIRWQFDELFRKVPHHVLAKDRLYGNLDMAKVIPVAVGITSGEYDHHRIKPMMRIETTRVKKPSIGIAISASMRDMWRNKNYIPYMVILGLAMSEAARAANMDVWMVSTERYNNPSQFYSGISLATIFITPYMQTRYNDFWVAFNRDAWRLAHPWLAGRDKQGHAKLAYAMGMPNSTKTAICFGSQDASGHIKTWLKTAHQCDFVICLGNFGDLDDAVDVVDVHEESDFDSIRKRVIDGVSENFLKYFKS